MITTVKITTLLNYFQPPIFYSVDNTPKWVLTPISGATFLDGNLLTHTVQVNFVKLHAGRLP